MEGGDEAENGGGESSLTGRQRQMDWDLDRLSLELDGQVMECNQLG